MTKTPNAPGTQKVRRARLGRAPGWGWQASGRRVRRADVRELKRGADDPSLSGVGGLVDFNGFAQRERLGRQLVRNFGHPRIHEAKTQFSQLVDRAHAGEEIVVAKDGEPWARLVPLAAPSARQPGLLRGLRIDPASSVSFRNVSRRRPNHNGALLRACELDHVGAMHALQPTCRGRAAHCRGICKGRHSG